MMCMPSCDVSNYYARALGSGWQTGFLRALRPAMDRTDKLLIGLHDSIAEAGTSPTLPATSHVTPLDALFLKLYGIICRGEHYMHHALGPCVNRRHKTCRRIMCWTLDHETYSILMTWVKLCARPCNWERRLLRSERGRVHEGFLAAGNLLAAAEAFCWRLVDEREGAAREHATLSAAADECEAGPVRLASYLDARHLGCHLSQGTRVQMRWSTWPATFVRPSCEALSAAAAAAAAADATAAAAAAAAAANAVAKEKDAAGHAVGSEAAAWAELESLADMLLGAREAAIKTAAERDLLALQGVGSSEVAGTRMTRSPRHPL